MTDSSTGTANRTSTNRIRAGRHTVRWVALGVLVVVAALVAALVNRPSATAVAVYSPLVGKQAPAINGVTVTGQPFALSSLEGRWVVLDFFASWCGPCQEEQPNLVAFAYQHQGPEAPALVGVVYGDTASNVLHFMSSTGATWPAVTDPNAQIAFAYGVRGTPETFLISPSGRVVAHLDAPVSTVSLDQLLARAGAAT